MGSLTISLIFDHYFITNLLLSLLWIFKIGQHLVKL